MSFELIVARNQDGIIGINNKIPWHIPEDLQHFKRMTEGHIVLMGRKTYESLPQNNCPLKNRVNIVLTNQSLLSESPMENLIFTNKDNVFNIIKTINRDKKEEEIKKVFIIGGSEIYNLFIAHCSKIHITEIIYSIPSEDCNNNIIFFPYNEEYFIKNGFFKEEEEEDKSTIFLISKTQNIEFRYITYILRSKK